MSRKSRWSRPAAMVLIAAAGLSFAPPPAVAADPECHTPVPQQVLTPAHGACADCAQPSCVAMPGCVQVVAVVAAPVAGPASAPSHHLVQPEAPVIQDRASRGPPTPPPNS